MSTQKRPRSHKVVLVVNVILSFVLVTAGLVVVWANNKVGDRLVVSIDGATSSASTSESGATAGNEWNYDTNSLRSEEHTSELQSH